MEIESVLIKIEPGEPEVLDAYGAKAFDCGTSHNCVKSEVNSYIEYTPSNVKNEESTSFNIKKEPLDSINNEETVLKSPEMEVEDIFNEEDLVDLSKLKQLLNQSKNIPECSNITYEDKDCDTISFVDKKRIIKKEGDESDILEDPLQLAESNDLTSEENEHKKKNNNQNQRTMKPNQEQHKKDIKIDNDIYKCKHCSYKSNVRYNLVRHNKRAHNEDKVKLNCQFCDKSFLIKRSLTDHLLKQHGQEIKSDMKDLITSKLLSCNMCTYKTTRKDNLSKHINSMHNEQRIKKPCPFCDKSFALQMSLDDHVVKHHKEEINKINSKIYKCDMCSYETSARCYLVGHINKAHNNKNRLICLFCDKSFVFKYSLEDHLLKQHKEEIESDLKSFISLKILKCNTCSFETTVRSSLNVHINALHNEQRIKKHCQFCDKSFASQKSVDDHILKQHKKEIKNNEESFITTKVLKCNFCAFETTLPNNLNRHIDAMHNEQRIIKKCEFCDISFISQRSLDDHILKQHRAPEEINKIKSKIHKCQNCAYETTFKQCLDKHKC